MICLVLLPPSFAEIFRQCRHICKKISSSSSSSLDALTLAAGVVIMDTWRCITATYHCPCNARWASLTGPLVINVCKPLLHRELDFDLQQQHESQREFYLQVVEAVDRGTYLLAPSGSFLLSYIPLLARISTTATSDLSPAQRERLQEVMPAMSSSSYHWWLWYSLDRTVAAVHVFKGGVSQACGVKISAAAAGAEPLQFHVVSEKDVCTAVKMFLGHILMCFKAYYLLLPGERALTGLQQQQLPGGASKGTESSSSSTLSSTTGGTTSSSSSTGGTSSTSSSVATKSSSISSTMDLPLQPGSTASGTAPVAAAMAAGFSSNITGYTLDVMKGGGKRPHGLFWLLVQPPLEVVAVGRYGAVVGRDMVGGCSGIGSQRRVQAGLPEETASAEMEKATRAATSQQKSLEPKTPSSEQQRGVGDSGNQHKQQQQQLEHKDEGGLFSFSAVSPEQLELLVKLLLLCWPASNQKPPPQAAADEQGLPMFSHKEFSWDSLLLLVALLQQASAAAKQQLLEQESGEQLLQLLHLALLQQDEMEAGQESLDSAKLLLWDKPQSGMLEKWVARERSPAGAGVDTPSDSDACVPMGAVQLVLMVLQSLLLTADPWEVVGAEGMHTVGLGLEIREGEGES